MEARESALKPANLIKTSGYGSSVLSVFLLAAPSLKSAIESPWLLASLIAGMTTSIVGMAMRWYSYQIEKE